MRHVSQKGLAMDWLQDRLANGAVSSRILYAEGKELGFSTTVMLRAASNLDILSTSVSGKFGRETVWSLPEL